MHGKNTWIIADGYMSNTQNEKNVSHEAVCVLNLSGKTANIEITVYFEDEEPLYGFKATCENNRTNHIRLDKAINENGQQIPKDKPYALLICSDQPIICQHTRLDVSSVETALMTTIAY